MPSEWASFEPPASSAPSNLSNCGRVGDQAQRTAQRARTVQSPLRPAQNLDAVQIVQLKITVNRGIADVGPDGGLLEGAKAARAATSRSR